MIKPADLCQFNDKPPNTCVYLGGFFIKTDF